ncbi:unnamed protein product [[Candida] boidinii]|uniref:Unnamed protein product n=1 Tax=Candida boidinii TaxID=5477 RepID=A0A9W6SV20_CANBO|nr:unnamed protein product [[Candida] boidinii]
MDQTKNTNGSDIIAKFLADAAAAAAIEERNSSSSSPTSTSSSSNKRNTNSNNNNNNNNSNSNKSNNSSEKRSGSTNVISNEEVPEDAFTSPSKKTLVYSYSIDVLLSLKESSLIEELKNGLDLPESDFWRLDAKPLTSNNI